MTTQSNEVKVKLVSSEHGFDDFDVDNLPNVHRACVGRGIKKGDIFNVYCSDGVKLGASWCGEIKQSLANFAKTNVWYHQLCGAIIWTKEDSIAASEQGWCIFKSVGDKVELQLQREDGMEVFASDDEAALFVKTKAADGIVLAQKAILYLKQEGSSDVERFALHKFAVTSNGAVASHEM